MLYCTPIFLLPCVCVLFQSHSVSQQRTFGIFSPLFYWVEDYSFIVRQIDGGAACM